MIAAIFANMAFIQLHAEELKALPGAEKLPLSLFSVSEDLEISLWANTPDLYNLACMSTDAKGRIWVAEGVNYRNSVRNSTGDRIVTLEETDGDGKADSSKIFYQSPELATPMARAFAKKLISYMTGREPGVQDEVKLDLILKETQEDSYRVGDLYSEILKHYLL